MADKSFGVKELNLISASGTPTITSPNSVNINATNVAISTDITVGGMVSLGAGTSISSPGNNVLTFGTNDDERLRIDADGQLVINRSSGAILATSQSKLEVYNSTQNLIFVANSTAATNQDAGIMFAPANNVYGGKIVVTSDEDFSTGANRTAHMAFYTRQDGSATEKLRITSSGSIGMGGITSPSFTTGSGLHLADNFAIGFGDGGNSRPDFQIATTNGSSLDFRCGFGADTADISMTTGGNLVFANGGGIDFSATSDASGMSSEVLDDYEEGSWTPSITLGGGSTGMTYSRQEGHYTKIGRQVFAQFRITLTAKGSSTGQLRINGLPFTSADTFSSTGIDGQVHMGHDNGFNAGNVGSGAVAGYVEGGTSYFLLTRRDTNASLDTMTNTFIDNDLSISGTAIFYA